MVPKAMLLQTTKTASIPMTKTASQALAANHATAKTLDSSAYQPGVNAQQQEAILSTEGPVHIITGPGSGKTFTLVERLIYLISRKGVTPESLLVVTFTEKAARELTTRISNRLAELGIQFNLNEMYLGIFHFICLRLLEAISRAHPVQAQLYAAQPV